MHLPDHINTFRHGTPYSKAISQWTQLLEARHSHAEGFASALPAEQNEQPCLGVIVDHDLTGC